MRRPSFVISGKGSEVTCSASVLRTLEYFGARFLRSKMTCALRFVYRFREERKKELWRCSYGGWFLDAHSREGKRAWKLFLQNLRFRGGLTVEDMDRFLIFMGMLNKAQREEFFRALSHISQVDAQILKEKLDTQLPRLIDRLAGVRKRGENEHVIVVKTKQGFSGLLREVEEMSKRKDIALMKEPVEKSLHLSSLVVFKADGVKRVLAMLLAAGYSYPEVADFSGLKEEDLRSWVTSEDIVAAREEIPNAIQILANGKVFKDLVEGNITKETELADRIVCRRIKLALDKKALDTKKAKMEKVIDVKEINDRLKSEFGVGLEESSDENSKD
ncbi:MAG: hypothetical protein QXT73_01200 [Candidatus Methanomethylicaceae archaeon]